MKVNSALRRTAKIVVSIAALLVVANVVLLALSGIANGSPVRASIHEVAREFGLDSGKAYPLDAGQPVTSASGTLELGGQGFFLSAAEIEVHPGSSLPIGFQNGEHSYILELPYSKITWRQEEGVQPTVTLHISEGPSNVYLVNHNEVVMVGWLPLFMVERTGTMPLPSSPDWPAVEREGLGTQVSNNLEGAEVVLPPELYSQLLGR